MNGYDTLLLHSRNQLNNAINAQRLYLLRSFMSKLDWHSQWEILIFHNCH